MSGSNSEILVNMPQYNSEEITELHQVLINYEEQYSLWPGDKEVPVSWQKVFGPKSKKECLKYIKEKWIDMRPLSLRKKMTKIETQ